MLLLVPVHAVRIAVSSRKSVVFFILSICKFRVVECGVKDKELVPKLIIRKIKS